MDWSKVGNTLKTIAPWIAGTFGTPAAGVAVQALCSVFGGDSKSATPDSLQAALAGATPDQLLALKTADLKHAEFMQQLGYQHIEALLQSQTADRDSARKREMTVKDKVPAALAIFAVACFISLIIAVMRGVSIDAGMKDTFLILVGAAIAVFKDVYGYYFGSSAGSKTKDDTINSMSGS